MKIHDVIPYLYLTLILISCGQTTLAHPTDIFVPEPVPTSSPSPEPSGTPTSPPKPTSETRIDLSSELYLDENSSPDDMQGEPFMWERVHFSNANGNGFVTMIGDEQWVAGLSYGPFLLPFDDQPPDPRDGSQEYSIQLWQDGEMLYSFPSEDGLGPEPKRILRYDDHWIFWFMNDWEDQGWVVQDGVLLNDLHEYDNAFSLFLLGDKPFFFFQRGDRLGISFDGEETLLPYSSISYGPICCENGGSGNPRGTDRMVGFYVVEENAERRYIEIGLK